MMNFGLAYRFQVSVFCCLGSWAQDPPPPLLCRTVGIPPPCSAGQPAYPPPCSAGQSGYPPPVLCGTVFFIPIFSPTVLAGGSSHCESGTVNLKPYFPLSFPLHACILSLRCAALIQTTSSLSLTEPSPVAAGVLNPGVRSLPGDAHFSEWIQACPNLGLLRNMVGMYNLKYIEGIQSRIHTSVRIQLDSSMVVILCPPPSLPCPSRCLCCSIVATGDQNSMQNSD